MVNAWASQDDARSTVKKMVTFTEIFGRGSMVQEANRHRGNLNVQGLRAMDLRTMKPSGDSWDFDRREDRRYSALPGGSGRRRARFELPRIERHAQPGVPERQAPGDICKLMRDKSLALVETSHLGVYLCMPAD